LVTIEGTFNTKVIDFVNGKLVYDHGHSMKTFGMAIDFDNKEV
jgi:hypothetical protein